MKDTTRFGSAISGFHWSSVAHSRLRNHSIVIVAWFALLLSSSEIFAQSWRPVELTTSGSHVFMKADVSPSPPDLEKRYIRWCHEGEYVGRQFTAQGVDGKFLLQTAFLTTGDRVLDLAGLPDTALTVDVVVPPGREQVLVAFVQSTISTALNVSAGWEPVEMMVGLLREMEGAPQQLQPSENEVTTWRTDQALLKGTALSLGHIANILASSGVGMPILDQTELKDRYDVSISWRDGDMESLNAALADVGLHLFFETREIDMVVVRPRE